MLGDVERGRSVGVPPATAKQLAQDRVVRLLKPFGLFVETRKVPLNHRFDAGERIIFEHGSGQDVGVIVVIGKFVKERARFQDEGR